MKKELSDYHNPLEANDDFEKALAEFTGANGVVVVDSCTHAIELGLRYAKPKMYATLPQNTHFTVPMTLANLGIEYMFTEDNWENEYRIEGSNVYVAANQLAKDMFQTENPNQRKIICLSFGPGAPLDLGGGGAILTNDKKAYDWLKLAANDGRDLSLSNWRDQKVFKQLGFHYGMRPADAVRGIDMLADNEFNEQKQDRYSNYPDMREVLLNK